MNLKFSCSIIRVIIGVFYLFCAKTYALTFALNYLKMIYVKRTPESNKTVHVVSSALKAILTWHCMRTLQECREACGGQGLKTENHVGHLNSEYDVQLTFEGDNNVLMQQVSKALLAEFLTAKKRNKPFKALGLEHLNKPTCIVPSQLTSSILRTTQFQTDMFCLRERDLLHRFATEVSQYQAQGESKEHIFRVVSGPLDPKPKETIIGNALFRWQSDVDDPHTFGDLYVSTSDPILLMRACAYYPEYGIGAFGVLPVLQKKSVSSEDYGLIGLRYGSSNLSLGATLMPYSLGDEFPKFAWLVSKIGRLTAGVQYDPKCNIFLSCYRE